MCVYAVYVCMYVCMFVCVCVSNTIFTLSVNYIVTLGVITFTCKSVFAKCHSCVCVMLRMS